MLAFYFITSICVVREYEKQLYYRLIPENGFTLAFFYNAKTNLDEARSILKKVNDYTEEFDILMINCDKFVSLCENRHVHHQPSIHLFKPNRFEGVEMSLEMSTYNIIDFLKPRASINVRLPPSRVINIKRSNYDKFFYNGNYHIIEFIQSNDQKSEMLNTSFEEIAQIYSQEFDIKFGRVDCSQDVDFCYDIGTAMAPIIRIYKENGTKVFEGRREIPDIISFINQETGKHRNRNGDYSFSFDAETEQIIKDFMKKPNKHQYIQQIQSKPNGESFSVIMNRVIQSKTVESQLKTLNELSLNRNVSQQSKEKVMEAISMLNLFRKYEPYVDEKEL